MRDVRGRGLMVGVELADPALGPMLTGVLAQGGVLALYANNHPATMIVMPPLIVEVADIDAVLAAFERAFAILDAQAGG